MNTPATPDRLIIDFHAEHIDEVPLLGCYQYARAHAPRGTQLRGATRVVEHDDVRRKLLQRREHRTAAMRALADRLESKTPVKMDIGNHRNRRATPDRTKGNRRGHIRHRNSDDLAPGPCKPAYLAGRGCNIPGISLCHGLDNTRRAPAYLNSAEDYLFSWSVLF